MFNVEPLANSLVVLTTEISGLPIPLSMVAALMRPNPYSLFFPVTMSYVAPPIRSVLLRIIARNSAGRTVTPTTSA